MKAFLKALMRIDSVPTGSLRRHLPFISINANEAGHVSAFFICFFRLSFDRL